MEPITTGAAIGALVTLMGKWLHYDIEKRKLEQVGESAPAKTEAAQQGEQVAHVVETGIAQHGNDDEKADLANFRRNPERYADMLQHVLTDLASREPGFAQQLQGVAAQTSITQTGGIHGTVNIQGDNTGQTAGVNYGTMTQDSQDIHNNAPNEGAQGTFHGPVSFSRQDVSGAGAVGIGGDVSNSPITTESGNTVTSIGGDQINAQESQGFINRPTGPVTQHYGDTVGGDKSSGDITAGDVAGNGIALGHKAQAYVQQGITGTDLTQLFAPIYQQIEARQSPGAIKAVIADHVHKIEDEAQKGNQANAQQIEGWLAVIASMAPDILQVVASTLINPMNGIATTVQKIAEWAQREWE